VLSNTSSFPNPQQLGQHLQPVPVAQDMLVQFSSQKVNDISLAILLKLCDAIWSGKRFLEREKFIVVHIRRCSTKNPK